MKISIDQPAKIHRIVLDGRLDVDGTHAVEEKFNATVAKHHNIIVDLSKVSFVSSLGIRMLVAGAQACSKHSGKMVLVAPDELTRRIFKTTGIDQLVTISNTITEAQAAF